MIINSSSSALLCPSVWRPYVRPLLGEVIRYKSKLAQPLSPLGTLILFAINLTFKDSFNKINTLQMNKNNSIFHGDIIWNVTSQWPLMSVGRLVDLSVKIASKASTYTSILLSEHLLFCDLNYCWRVVLSIISPTTKGLILSIGNLYCLSSKTSILTPQWFIYIIFVYW